MRTHTGAVPIARVFYRGGEVLHHGWFVQHYVRDQLQTIRLEVREGAEPADVVTEAAGFVGCIPDQIQVEGTPWPPLQLPM
jgi:hypothetical protein